MKTRKRLLSILLSLAMVLGLIPGMSLTAYAADSSYEFTTSNNVRTYTNDIITVTAGLCDSEGIDLSPNSDVQITAVDDWMIMKIEMVCNYISGSPSADEITATNGTVTTQGAVSKGTTVTIDNINANSTSISRNKFGWLQFNQFKIYYGIAHTHNFTYSASGGTITATCGGTGTCDITEGLILTISAPTGNLVYDGTTTYPATLSTGYNTTAFPGTYSISYKKDGSAYSGVPKDAGTYTASVTAGTGDAAKTASVSYTVTKAAATVTKVPVAKTLTYNGKAQELVTAGTATGGTMQYALGTATEATGPYTTSIPSKTDAGTYYVWYKAKGDSNHIDSATASVIVTIAEKQTEAPVKETPDNPIDEAAPAKIQANASIQLNADFLVYWKGSTVCVKWGKTPEADQFEIYAQYCGSKTCKKIMTVKSGNSASFKRLNGKKLNRKRFVKVYVVASKNGKEIGRTLLGHAAGSKNSHTNAKKVKVSKKSYTLTVGKSAKIKAKIVKAKSGKKLLGKGHCAKVRYTSSNTKVATVSKSGKIKAVGKGKCDIRIFAQNGRSCKVTVTVK